MEVGQRIVFRNFENGSVHTRQGVLIQHNQATGTWSVGLLPEIPKSLGVTFQTIPEYRVVQIAPDQVVAFFLETDLSHRGHISSDEDQREMLAAMLALGARKSI